MRGSKATSVPFKRVEGQGAHHVGGADEAQDLGQGEAAHRGHELGAVDEGQALLRLEGHRLEAGRGERLARLGPVPPPRGTGPRR